MRKNQNFLRKLAYKVMLISCLTSGEILANSRDSGQDSQSEQITGTHGTYTRQTGNLTKLVKIDHAGYKKLRAKLFTQAVKNNK